MTRSGRHRHGGHIRGLVAASIPQALLLAGSVAVLPLMQPALHGQEPDLVEAVIRVDIERGPSEVLPALVADSVLLLPLQQLFDMAELRVEEEVVDRYALAILEPSNIVLRFDSENRQLVVGDSSFALQPFDAAWSLGALYVSVGALAQALGLRVRVDWEELAVVFGHTDGLPVIRRARRERQRAIALRPRPVPPRAAPALVRESVADGAVLQWSLTSSTASPIDNTSLDLGLGAKLLGGSVELRHRLNRVSGSTRATTRGSWERAWPDERWIRQVRLGDVSSSGRRSRFVQGAVVTNEPFIRSAEFDVEELVGQVPPGWEVELYDRRGLLDFGMADPFGDFRVALPIRYGSNPFDMVLYGPRGEVVRRRRTVRVPFSRLPEGQLEYAVGGGRCRFDPCSGMLLADARYGITSRVTAQLGSDVFWRESSSPLWQPYAVLSAAITRSLSVTGEAVVNGLLGARLEMEPTPDLRASLAHTEFDSDGSPFTSFALERRRTDASVFWRPDRLPGAMYFQFVGTLSSGLMTNRNAQRMSATARFGNARYSVNLLRSSVGRNGGDPLMTRTVVDIDSDLVLQGRSRWLRSATVRGGLSIDFSRGLASVRAGGSRRVGRTIRVDLGVGWFRDMGGFTIDLGLNTVLPGPRFGSRNRFSTDTGTDGVQFVDGSVLWDRSTGHVRFGDGRDLGRAGVAGVVFLDANGNGARDAGEAGMEGVPLRVGGWTTDTDSLGRFSAWDLFPFEPAFIEVDTLSFDNPFLVLPNQMVQVSPTPNSFLFVEIPVAIGAEVSGQVLLEGRGVPGVQVILRNVDTGDVVRLLTFTDGGFYYLGLPPGVYELSLPSGFLRSMQARAEPITVTVPAGGGEKVVEGLMLRVEREP